MNHIRLLMIFFIALSLITSSVSAQEESCDFDLTAVRAKLDEAQQAFDDGNITLAMDALKAAQDQITALKIACSPQPDVKLVEMALKNGRYTFLYPESWEIEFESDEPAIVLMGSTATALDRMSATEPTLAAGEQAIGVIFMNANDLDSFFGVSVGGEITPVMIAQSLSQTLNSDDLVIRNEPESMSINDHRAALMTLKSSGAEIAIYVLDLRRGEEFGIFVAIAAPGELERLNPLILEMVKSAKFDPDAVEILEGGFAPPTLVPTPTS